MKKKLIIIPALILAAFAASCGSGTAPVTSAATEPEPPQTAAAETQPATPLPVEIPKCAGGNPIAGFDAAGELTYGGDPSALVVGDTLYLYVGHDTAKNESYVMPDYLCYSTKDMENWTFEGVVMKMTDVKWGDRNSAWAGQVARHYDPAAGKDRYYLYFCSWAKTDSGKQSIGVAVSDSPTGPFTDIGEPLIKGSFTTDETSAWNDIDPTVWIEEDDSGEEHRYLMWGNSKLYICELNEDMISVKDTDGDGAVTFRNDVRTKMPPDSFSEAPWIYRRKDAEDRYYGDYYLFYAYGWREQMAYATTHDLIDGRLYFQDVIMKPTATSNTNHMAVVDFLGETWFIYHNGSLPGGSGYRRVVCAAKLSFYADGAVAYVDESAAGINGTVSAITALNGGVLKHERFSNSTNDGAYPYRNIALTSGKPDKADSDAMWVIRAGKASPEDIYTVSIESENKPGLYITARDGSAVLSQDYDGKAAGEQTFHTVEGLAGEGFSFEAFSTPGMYLTLTDEGLTLTDGTDAAAASFLVEDITER